MQKNVTQGSTVTATQYFNGFQYVDGVLQFFSHDEGYVNNTVVNGNNVYNYVFNYTDHLGNVRLSYGVDPATGVLKVLEENNYYPFGLKHKNYNMSQKTYIKDGGKVVLEPCSGCAKTYQFKFNGKELQDELGLNVYDYGARNYDPALGRWSNMDAKAEKYLPLSPYTYALNNPMFFVDPDGNEIDIYYGKDNKEKVKYGYQKDRDYTKIKDSYLADAYKALDALYENSNIEVDGKQTNLMQTLMDDKRELSVVEGGEDGGSHFSDGRSYPDAGDGSTKTKNNIGTIYFNRKEGVMYNDTNDAKKISDLYDSNGKLKPTTRVNSPTSVLGHEIGHAFNFATNPTEYFKRKADISTRNLTPYFRNAEESKATTLSTQININLGEFPRRNYYATGVQTTGVLSNKVKN
ncbi:RHS repeat-associated core domain-containing protein [Flavobacterium humi]|uniref:RHS repeat-associated core domain-containing protein n=1 Tax=Flavobacterium humi TaxID=2562683 RepID=A0A4Z0L8C2_9FLAO|nr:RHS repeat-associated core domain-containing protein [Flavobacterium humi]TGD57855.1 RHS repeat-associated core domain-containing protein [Flavobacterium humi]